MVKVGTILSGFFGKDIRDSVYSGEEDKRDSEMYIVVSIDTDNFNSDTALLISIRPSNYIYERLTITTYKIWNYTLWFNIDDTHRADYDEW